MAGEKKKKELLARARRALRGAWRCVYLAKVAEQKEYTALPEAEKKAAEGERKADRIDMLDDAVDEISCLIDTLEECKKEAAPQ